MPTLKDILAAQAAPTKGVVIRAADEKAKMAASIKSTLDNLAPKIMPSLPLPRELGAMETGERVPTDYPSPEATIDEKAWFTSLHSFDSDMAIVIDPSGQQAWIAVRRSKFDPNPLLLLKLPLLKFPSSNQPS